MYLIGMGIFRYKLMYNVFSLNLPMVIRSEFKGKPAIVLLNNKLKLGTLFITKSQLVF